jgi:16S rRNA G1207 methylase RsmC
MTKEEKKAKNQEKRANKKAALKKVLAFVKENSNDQELLSAARLLTPGQRIIVSAKKDVIAELFMEKSVIHEDEIWSAFKMGRPQMRKVRVNLIKKAAVPEERVWIDFDTVSGNYTLLHIGAETPKGWTGYTPIEMDDFIINDDEEEEETDIDIEE